ncbi:MAG TPA: peptidase M28, partial [Saprospiraceae bacterium]|nr:peptidase M28 [Saprospiraceae bacterium]
MRFHLLLFLILSSSFSLYAQMERRDPLSDDQKQVELAKLISVEGLHRHLSILASDEYQGRETGEKGQKMAAKYISDIFDSYGLPKVNKEEDSYFQHYSYIAENWKHIALTINGKDYTHLVNYYAFPSKNSDQEIKANKVTFLGYGIDDEKYSDYKGVDVQGEVIVVFEGEPMKKNRYFLSQT